jgi:hypothetical protein
MTPVKRKVTEDATDFQSAHDETTAQSMYSQFIQTRSCEPKFFS